MSTKKKRKPLKRRKGLPSVPDDRQAVRSIKRRFALTRVIKFALTLLLSMPLLATAAEKHDDAEQKAGGPNGFVG